MGEGAWSRVSAQPHALGQADHTTMPIVYDHQCTVEHYRDQFEELDIPGDPGPKGAPEVESIGSLLRTFF